WGIGSTYYTDRTYTITGVSEVEMLDCLYPMYQLPNNDRNNTLPSGYMEFTMPFDGEIYIAFDSRLTSLPDWASDYVESVGAQIFTSLGTQPHMQLYVKEEFSNGDCVDLGGNKAPGASTGTASNYVVFLIDGFCTPPEPLCELDPKFGSGFADNGATYYEDRSYVITDA
ncbi:MAG: hypothetical protein GY941_13695, partial [Planctomycetes bacterium]|nr:hypothetical protein [Planctomycetota bacterium]